MCGFVERFNPALSTALGLLDENPIHTLTVRHSPTNVRASSSVVHDLLIHDIDAVIRMAADPSTPQVTAALWHPPGSEQSEIADCSLVFPDGFVSTLSASRWSQRKIRDIRIVTESALYEIDLLRVNLTVYRHVRQLGFGDTATYRAETIVDVPFVRHAGEPLALQLQHFLGLASGAIDAASERATILSPHEVAFEVDRR
jgi:predicted dehydrogenase